jgi:hypothetical protein
MDGLDVTDLAPLASDGSGRPVPQSFVVDEAFQLEKNLILYSQRFLTKEYFQRQAFLRLEECRVCLCDAYFKVSCFSRTYIW